MSALRFFSCWFVKLLILHNILNQTSFQAVSLPRGQESSGLFIDHVNYVLDVPKIQSKEVTNMVHCLHECVRNHRCFSTNVMAGREKNGRLRCQLLSTDKYNASVYFRPRKLCHHFSLVSPCEGAPCKNGGMCRALYETDEYECECLSNTVGKNCESSATPCDLADGWLHFSASCYKFFSTPVDKQKAKTQCGSVGAHLTTIHSASEQDFITSSVIPPSVVIWSGLERDMNSGTFTNWDDGCPVDFTDWGRNRPTSQDSGEHCVALRPSRTDPLDYIWNDLLCTAERAFVCEKGA